MSIIITDLLNELFTLIDSSKIGLSELWVELLIVGGVNGMKLLEIELFEYDDGLKKLIIFYVLIKKM